MSEVAMFVGIMGIIAVVLRIFGTLGAGSVSTILKKKMQSLGKIKGRHYDDIIKVAGKPTTTESSPNWIKCTWSSAKYSVVLGFNMDGICTGVLSEITKQ